MHIIDVAIVVLYLIACIIIGLYKSKSIRTLKEYTLGRGYFSNIVIITTLFATYIGAGSIMISIERIYAFGAFFILIRLLFPLSWLIMGKIYGENIDQFRSCMSVSDMMELLYGKVARWITNVAGVFLSIGMVSIQFVALGYIVNYFLGISYPCGIITSALIIAIYSAFGGVRAVAFTDIFQCAVMMIAIPVAFSFLYHDVGGYKGIIQFLPEDEINLNIDKNDILLFLSMIFYAVFPLSAGVYIQRFLMCRDSIQLTHCLNVVAVMSFFLTIIICTIGLIFKIKEPGMDPNVVLLHFITHYIPIGFKGLIISGLLAMMMSTADSWLNNTSIIFVHDIIRKIIPLTERQALVFAKTFTCIICIVSALWALNSKKLLDIGLIAVNFWVPIISIPLIAGFLKFRTNSKSFMAATLLAIIFANVSGYIVGKLENISLMFATIGSAIGLFGMHYWQVHQGTLSVNTQPTQFTETAIDKDTDIGSKALAESQGRQMFEDVEDQTKTIADELRKQSFEKGRLAEREEVAKNLLLQGLDISIIESATGLSREDLNALQKGKH